MSKLHDKRFPNESGDYRKLRDELLQQEIDLRQRIENIAALRRQLPMGGELKENYIFDEDASDLADTSTEQKTHFSDLFEDEKDNLIVYSFMFASDADTPCPACTSLIDGLNGSAPHIRDRVSFVVVAKAPIGKFRHWAASRNWQNLRLLSSSGNSYNQDYFGESEDGSQQMPAMNVFRKNNEIITHFYSTELLYTAPGENQHPRHVDLLWPVWNLFDLTPDGRGEDWFPKTAYD